MENINHKEPSFIKYHLIYWAIYIIYEVIFIIAFNQVPTSIFNYVYYYCCNISLFYIHFYILTRYLNGPRKRYEPLIFSIIAELLVITIVKGIADYYSIRQMISSDKMLATFQTYTGLGIFRSFYYLILSTVLWSALNLGKLRRNAMELSLERVLIENAHADLKYQFAQAQNAFLKQQINPHLLFNTLNAIYSSVYIHSPEDSRLVLLLSAIMRFSYEDADPQGRVPLKNEIEQLKNLIELNSYRFHETVQLELSIIGEPGELSIIPLVLITLTENMFKHGDLRQTPRRLEIKISSDGKLKYFGRNVPKPRDTHKKGTNVGLTNTKLRLDYAYPDNYELNIKETNDLFSLDLNINLTYERNNH